MTDDFTDAEIAAFRAELKDRLVVLESLDRSTEESRAPVTLDQQSVGRLSRMDAMQQQAMAVASRQRRRQEQAAIRTALARIESGDFGYCPRCGEPIARKRLQLDPTATLCIACARG